MRPDAGGLAEVLAAVDRAALAADVQAVVQVPSLTGDELPVLERLQGIAAARGLEVELHRHDLAALRAHPRFPGMEAPRDELWTLAARLPAAAPAAARLAVNGHVDVVDPGTIAWTHGEWSGAVDGDRLYGRGAVDMKGAVVAALHGIAAIRDVLGAAPAEIVLLAVSAEEDGGAGSFAELERDARYDACLVVEPTEGDVVCAQAGALTFTGLVPGRTAHAAMRLAGCSALDRYVRIHAALQEHERRLNAGVADPLMRRLALPYPLLVGKIHAGAWSSQVPDALEFEGRVGVRIGESLDAARASFERVVREASDDGEAPVEIRWSGGQFASGATDPAEPFAALVQAAMTAETGRTARAAGVPYGADMRLFTERGIPCVMAGTAGIERAHAVDEWVSIDELAALARSVARVALGL